MPKKVLIFCDPGIDDAMALLLAFFIDKIEIIGIVADYGNVPKEMAVQNAHFLKHETKNRNIKVFGGSEQPLTGAPPRFLYECTRETRTRANYSKRKCDKRRNGEFL